MEFNPRKNRTGFAGPPDSSLLVYEATVQSLLLPGHPISESDPEVLVSLRDADGTETQACHPITDPYNMNCILPNESVQVIFDSTSGSFVPCGSNGLVRQVRSTQAISSAVDASGACQLISRTTADVAEDVGEIFVYGDGTAIASEAVFWAVFRRDFAKIADIAAGDDPLDKTLKARAGGRWVQLAASASASNGIVHGTADDLFDDTNATVSVSVTLSNITDVTVGQTVEALNYVGHSGNQDAECYVYYHGDGTGNEDGTFSLLSARCPS